MTVVDGDVLLTVSDTLVVRASLESPGNLIMHWLRGDRREEFLTVSPRLAALVLSFEQGTRRSIVEATSEFLGSDGGAAELVDFLIDTELLESVNLLPRAAEEAELRDLWMRCGWHDALLFNDTVRELRWRADYPPQPQVMTWYHGDKPVKPEGARPSIPAPSADFQRIALQPVPGRLASLDLLRTTRMRRTSRNFTHTHIDLEQLSAVLELTFSPMIVGVTRDYYATQSSTDGFRELVTPTPITCHVLAEAGAFAGAPATRSVLEYVPSENSLVVLDELTDETAFPKLLWEQSYVTGAPVLLVFSVNWSEYMYKYRFSAAYTFSQLDLGAFMQTAVVVATALGLRTFQTPALNDVLLSKMLGFDEGVRSPGYVVALGTPDARVEVPHGRAKPDS